MIDLEQIDPPVRRLVEVLNRMPGVDTHRSCGGHPKPKPGHSELGYYTVDFRVHLEHGGWRSLELIAFAVTPWGESVSLEVSSHAEAGPVRGAIEFGLSGSPGISANKFADVLEVLLPTYVATDEALLAQRDVYGQDALLGRLTPWKLPVPKNVIRIPKGSKMRIDPIKALDYFREQYRKRTGKEPVSYTVEESEDYTIVNLSSAAPEAEEGC